MNTNREVLDRELSEKLDRVARVKMPAAKQRALWSAIDEQMRQQNALGDRTSTSGGRKPSAPGVRRSGALGTSAAAVAAVAILGSGFYAWSQHGLTSGNGTGTLGLTTGSNVAGTTILAQGPGTQGSAGQTAGSHAAGVPPLAPRPGSQGSSGHTTDSHAASVPPSTQSPGSQGSSGHTTDSHAAVSGVGNAVGQGPLNGTHNTTGTATAAVPVPASFQSITVADSGPMAMLWSPTVFTQTAAHVQSMLKGAVSTSVHIPPTPAVSFHANTNPATLHLVAADGQNITVAPMHYMVAGAVDQNGNQTYHQKYIDGVITYTVNGQVTDLRAPAMYDWLKNNQWKSTFQVGISANKTQYSNAQLAAMTAQQLAAYNVKYQQALPFASGDITRNVPAQLLLVSNPKSGSILGSPHVQVMPSADIGVTHSYPATSIPANQLQVVDRWSGSVGAQQGVAVEVDRKMDGSDYVVAIARGPQVTAYSFTQQPYITNFTGSYMVMTTSNPAKRNPYYALNLQTGTIVGGRTAWEMSSDYLTMGANSNVIAGLPHTYTALPVIGGKPY